jgi:hypothetical protein
MAAGMERAGWGTTRKTFIVAGGCVLLAALVGRGWNRRAGGVQTVGAARPRRAQNLHEVARAGGVELRPMPVDPHGPVFRLNRSAAVVWRAVDGRRTVTGIAGVLGTTYGLRAAAASTDAIACLTTLAAQGLVNGVPGTRAGASSEQS